MLSHSCYSCLTLCNPMGCSLPGSSVRGIPQVRILEWVVISSLRESTRRRDRTCFSCIGRWNLYHRPTWKALFTNKTLNKKECGQISRYNKISTVISGNWREMGIFMHWTNTSPSLRCFLTICVLVTWRVKKKKTLKLNE